MIATPEKEKAPVDSLCWEEISRHSPEAAVSLFARQEGVRQRSFAALGKIYHHLVKSLPAGTEIYPLLQAQGIPKGSVSNASHAARVFARLVRPGHLSEAEFDTLTFTECVAILRAMKASPQALTAAAVAHLLRQGRETFVEGLRATAAQAPCPPAPSLPAQLAPPALRSILPADSAATSLASQASPLRSLSVVTTPAPAEAPPGSLGENPRVELRRLLDLAQSTLLEARVALALIRRDSPADRLISESLTCVGRLRWALNENAL